MTRTCDACGTPRKYHKQPRLGVPYICHPCRKQRRADREAEQSAAKAAKRLRCNVCNEPAVKPGRRCKQHRYQSTCIGCDKRFYGHAFYCSEPCRMRQVRCAHCEHTFVHRSSGRLPKWCSAECKRAYLAKTNSRPMPQWNCAVCGTLVVRTHGGTRGKYCAKHKGSMQNPARAASVRKREARKRGATGNEAIKPQTIFIRDGWRCGICHRHVDKRLRHPHPKSASLDHIVPLSRNGQHTKTNVQCAHLECNLRKGNRDHAQQLMLIG